MVTIGLTPPEGQSGAPVVVLAHSLGAGPIIWEKVGPMLQRSYRVSYLTLPGHGAVPPPAEPFSLDELADVVAQEIRGLDEGRVFFSGVSIGGALALTLAVRHAGVFHGVVPVAAVAEMGDLEAWAERAQFVREHTTAALVDGSATRWFAPSFPSREPEYSGRILQTLADTPSEGYARCGEALGTYDVAGQVGAIEVPMLLVAGGQDAVIPADGVAALAEQIPGARYALIEDAGHQVPAEQPQQVFAAMDAFFRAVR